MAHPHAEGATMGSDPPFDIRVESRNTVARVAVTGDLDLATAPELSAELAGVERDDVRSIMLDVRDVTFIDSTGLHAIIGAWKRAQSNGHQLVVVGATPAARRLCQIVGTSFILDDPSATETLDGFTHVDARTSAVGPRG